MNTLFTISKVMVVVAIIFALIAGANYKVAPEQSEFVIQCSLIVALLGIGIMILSTMPDMIKCVITKTKKIISRCSNLGVIIFAIGLAVVICLGGAETPELHYNITAGVVGISLMAVGALTVRTN